MKEIVEYKVREKEEKEIRVRVKEIKVGIIERILEGIVIIEKILGVVVLEIVVVEVIVVGRKVK